MRRSSQPSTRNRLAAMSASTCSAVSNSAGSAGRGVRLLRYVRRVSSSSTYASTVFGSSSDAAALSTLPACTSAQGSCDSKETWGKMVHFRQKGGWGEILRHSTWVQIASVCVVTSGLPQGSNSSIQIILEAAYSKCLLCSWSRLNNIHHLNSFSGKSLQVWPGSHEPEWCLCGVHKYNHDSSLHRQS